MYSSSHFLSLQIAIVTRPAAPSIKVFHSLVIQSSSTCTTVELSLGWHQGSVRGIMKATTFAGFLPEVLQEVSKFLDM